MELWIRSQDKESIIKIENISIDSENYIIGNLISDDNKSICDYWRLGHYETKERALEVLDKIQSLLKSKVLLNSGKVLGSFEDTIYREPDKVEIQELNTIVYEMPKE